MKKYSNPSSEFERAQAALKRLRQFSARAETQLQTFANTVFEKRVWTPIGVHLHTNIFDTNRPDMWMKMHGQTAYLRHKSAHKPLQAHELREKLLTDIMHDMGFPVATCTLYSRYQQKPDSILSAVACRAPTPVGPLQPSQSDSILPFIRQNDRLKPIFAALNVAHMFVGQTDDHDRNFITSRSKARNGTRVFYGIDYTEACTEDESCTRTVLNQSDFCYFLPDNFATMAAVRTALNVIKRYPAERITAFAKRLEPFAAETSYKADLEAKRLIARQGTIDYAAQNAFPSRVFRVA